MEKRLIIFLVLSILIIFTYPYFVSWLVGPATLEETSTPAPKEEVLVEKESEVPAEAVERTEREEAPTVVEVGEKEKVVETDLYRVVLSNVGGTIKRWELKKFTKKDPEGGEGLIQLISGEAKTPPLALLIESEPADQKRIYMLDEEALRLSKERPEGVVEMSFVGPEGKRIRKALRFHYDHYGVDLNVWTEGYNRGYDLSLGTNFGIESWGQQIGGAAVGAISLIGGEHVKDFPSKMSGTVTHEGAPTWVALQGKYFISALIPKEGGVMGPVSVRKEGEQEITVDLKVSEGGARTGNTFLLYAGPKEYDRLAGLKVGLEETIDFGWFIFGSWLPVRIVAKPLFYILRFFYRFTHNYGVAIILLTILVKLAFYPITRKSLISMKAMAAVQPKVAAIRKKWANDREKMNRELMNLYREEKINPVGGCLPMLVQIPVFVALFNILYTTIDLRQAPFMLWIQDLSDKDPYYVLPIIMGVSMFFQQYTQPSTMDPAQAKVMLFLPLIYTFFFLKFPSGLVLYWLVNNVLSIAQQYLMNREGLVMTKGEAT